MTGGSVGHNRTVKTVVVAVLGGLLTLSGIALLVLPGPGFVLVAAGLAVLATRFTWAKKPLDYAQDKAVAGVEEVGRSPWRAAGAVLAALALVAVGALVLAGVELPFTNAFTAVVLVISGLFLAGTVVFARHEEHVQVARAHRPAGTPGTGGAYRAATRPED
ncbi:PGPGW domain-containing protein [Modestobacter roseus]|uniref:PGPGW domain-containing protein n=1 Tax=Modestobacter roseus TaxID=1181884 RepID=UPI0034DF5148